MTRKDYVAFANLVQEISDEYGVITVAGVAGRMAEVFAVDNERFDRNKFFDACGIDGELAIRTLLIERGEGATAHLPVFPPVR